jgi:hypothetical protein
MTIVALSTTTVVVLADRAERTTTAGHAVPGAPVQNRSGTVAAVSRVIAGASGSPGCLTAGHAGRWS